MDNSKEYYINILEELDSLDREVSMWEADFLESLLEKCETEDFTLTLRQKAVIDKMKERYLA